VTDEIETLAKSDGSCRSDQIGKAGGCLVPRQVEEPRMQLGILLDGQLGIERKGLRHLADAPALMDLPAYTFTGDIGAILFGWPDRFF
jgi:hypothetical protein